jgi:putative DNA primase/helicase
MSPTVPESQSPLDVEALDPAPAEPCAEGAPAESALHSALRWLPEVLVRFLLWILSRHAELGGVTEIRAIKPGTRQDKKDREVWSAYVGPADLPDLVTALEPLPGPPRASWADGPRSGECNIYFSLNPVRPEAAPPRTGGRLFHRAKRATGDADVLAYSMLVIDVDPVREPRGRSATDEEKTAAGEVACQLLSELDAHGMLPMMGDSGNGYHLLVPLVPVPGDGIKAAADRAQDILRALSRRFSTTAADVDVSVHNPSRVLKLYGTLAVKGEHTDRHPHRLSYIDMDVVPADVDLEDGFRWVPPDDPSARQGSDRPNRQTRRALAAAARSTHAHSRAGWRDWCNAALAKIPLDAVYGAYLTGTTRNGWLGCRDPLSPTGDQHPSAGVSDGTGRARRGTFHSFRDGRTLSVIEFLIEQGVCADVPSARAHVAVLSGVPLPAPVAPASTTARAVLIGANRTDAGNAERFEALAGERFRFVPSWGKWLWYDDTRWRRDMDGEATRWALRTLRATAEAALTLDDDDAAGGLIGFAQASESVARIAGMLHLAETRLPVELTALDVDPDLFNCISGTIDLRTGELRPHDRGDLITRRSPVSYDPDATCPQWEAFLLRVLGGSTELVAFVQRAVGYSLTGHTTEQVLLMLYGKGANGKSTFLETVRALLGDYAAQADFTTFLKREGDGVRNDLARLDGPRLVAAVEAESGKALAEAVVKQVTGGDTITARFLFKEFFDFKPVFKLWLAANHKPHISGSDHGIWRRIRLVPFTVTIPEGERDRQLLTKLRQELPGILAWAVRGALAWREHGLGVPPEVQAATAAYRDEMDELRPFLDEATTLDASAHVTVHDLYLAYEAWCTANGERPRSKKGLAMRLGERGFTSGRVTNGVRCWKGVRLKDSTSGGGWQMGGAFSG